MGDCLHGRCKGAPAVRVGLVAGGGCYGDVEFGMSCKIKPKENICAFRMNKIGRNLDSLSKEEKF